MKVVSVMVAMFLMFFCCAALLGDSFPRDTPHRLSAPIVVTNGCPFEWSVLITNTTASAAR